jgi:hypothetical protein
MRDQPLPHESDPALEVLREQWDAAHAQAIELLHEWTEDGLSELRARIRRSQFRLVVNSSEP